MGMLHIAVWLSMDSYPVIAFKGIQMHSFSFFIWISILFYPRAENKHGGEMPLKCIIGAWQSSYLLNNLLLMKFL